MSSEDTVKLKFIDPQKSARKNKVDTFLYWPASHIPVNAKFSQETSVKNNKTTILAESFVNFRSTETCDEDVNYYIASRSHNGKLVCHPTRMYRMFPRYELKEAPSGETDESKRLSKREQLDELKEKFGSRKSQRDLASKRKYEIQFGEDDIDNLPTIKSNLKDATNDENTATNKTQEDSIDLEQQALSAILPPRNADAKSASEVYSLRDIITESEEAAIKEYEESLLSAMKNDYFKSFNTTPDNHVKAIYADLLLQLVRLSAYEMRKADPLPAVEGDIKKQLMERYTSTMQAARSLRYVITDQNKDRMYVYIFLLIFMLNNYKPIELETIQNHFKIPINKIRRMFELVGCYIENMRNVTGITVKVARLKLPLNVFKQNESKRKFRR